MEKLRPTEQEIADGTNLYNITPARTIRVGKRKGEFVPEKVSKNMKAIFAKVRACFEERGEDPPLTEKGQISTSRKTLKATDDPRLKLIADAGFTYKLLTTYVPVLERGTRVPINPRYNSPMETGRTSASSPNVQNPPRDGGVRECFIPRKGWVYAFADFKTLELCALSQVCLDILGKSTMAEAIRRGDDLHLSLAAQLLNIPVPEAKRRYEAGDPEVKGARQQAKVANFGFPGGLGVTSFLAYAEGVGLVISYDQAQELRSAWFATWPEMHLYFDHIAGLVEMHDQMTQLRSGRVRGGVTFTQAANGYFQGLAADGAKEALWRVSKECYVDKKSPLYGCRPVLFLHDEIALEVPYSDPTRASAAARRLSQVMIEAMGVFIPDIPISAEPVMMRRWYKGGEAVTVNGLLVPSRPEKVDGKTKWVADIDPVPLAANQLKSGGLLEQLLSASA
jgi:DNA polymerase-1